MPVKPLKITTSLVLDSTTKSELEALPFPDGLADAPFPLQDTVNYTTVYERTNPWHGLTPKWQMKVSTGLTCNGGGTSLFKTGAFTHYVWASGDKIYIAGGTNIAAGWYTIVSRDNDDYITISAPCNTDATSHNDITFWELTPANMTFDNDGPPVTADPNCPVTYSVIDVAAPGATNTNVAPGLTAPAYHLTAGSSAEGRADPAATLDYDIDGELRPLGAGRDSGADER